MKNKHTILFIAIAIGCLATFVSTLNDCVLKRLVGAVTTELHEKEQDLVFEMNVLDSLAQKKTYDELFEFKANEYNDLLNDEGMVLLIYENDSLRFWSDNSIAVENWRSSICLDSGMVQLANGTFEVLSKTRASVSIVGLILVKNEYPYQNKYLKSDFQNDFGIPEQVQMTLYGSDDDSAVYNRHGAYLFSLYTNGEPVLLGSCLIGVFILSVLAISLLVWWLHLFTQSLSVRIGKYNSALLFLVSIVVLRYLSILYRFPLSLYSMDLFRPLVYADARSIFLSSLGDLLINVLILVSLLFYIQKYFRVGRPMPYFEHKNKSRLLLVLYAFAVLTISFELYTVVVGLIQHSNIPFNVSNIFSLNGYTYTAIILSGIILWVSFIIIDSLVGRMFSIKITLKDSLICVLVPTCCYILLVLVYEGADLFVFLMPIALYYSIILVRLLKRKHSFGSAMFFLVLFASFGVYILTTYSFAKDIETRKIYAQHLAVEKDPIAEFLFRDIEKQILKDSTVLPFFDNRAISEFVDMLKKDRFYGYWDKYDVDVAVFDQFKEILFSDEASGLFDYQYYENILEQQVAVVSSHLYFVQNGEKKTYLAKFSFPIKGNEEEAYTLYLEFKLKEKTSALGFPELLLDQNVNVIDEFAGYSFAKYKNGRLVETMGTYPYLTKISHVLDTVASFAVLDFDASNHVVNRVDENKLIVVSKKQETYVDYLATFSYLFAVYSILLCLLLFIRHIVYGPLFQSITLNYRIQIFLVFIVFASVVLLGGGTVFYLKRQFKETNNQNISDKINSLTVDLQDKSQSIDVFEKSRLDDATRLLKQSANVFLTDINLYDLEGSLTSSSRLKLFQSGLISQKMNAVAFYNLTVLDKGKFVHKERIGELEYLSAYKPYKGSDGQIKGYVNVPYFAKQKKLEEEISGFLATLINIYVLLFALSLVVAIVISGFITQPLQLIKKKMSQIRLGKNNELIEWKDQDEIGSLVSEYNRMILALGHSADMLAESEREGAWREMAKQVAHEIKNPLTPMKLSVQHLQRVVNDVSPESTNMVNRLSMTITEQIDALSVIATEFSSFAKMPQANLEEVRLVSVLKNAVDLFGDFEGVKVLFLNTIDDEGLILADKQQLLRVFNNIIKNGIQAISDDKRGLVEVSLRVEEENYLIEIKDNGEGISSENLDNIFVPNFSTKNSGMGLGLAMVKKIIEDLEGKVWCQSTLGQGTSFYVQLPLLTSEKEL